MSDNPPISHRRQLAWTLVIATVVAIGALTLRPDPTPGALKPPLCFLCGEESIADLLLNLILFAPLGFGLALVGFRAGRVAALLLAFTVAIELLQFRVIPGRDASLNDIAANWLGGLTAFALAFYRRQIVYPAPREAALLALSAAALWILVIAGGTSLLRPVVRYQHYWVQWMPVPRGFTALRGDVLSVRLNGIELPPASVLPPEITATPLRSGDERITVVAVPGPPPGGRAIIVRLAAPTFEVFSLTREGASGSDLRFQSWVRGATLGLRRPGLLVPGAFPAILGPRDSVVMNAGVRHGTLFARLWHQGQEYGRTLSLTPGIAWALLLPRYRIFDSWIPLLNAVWIGLLLAPLGYWMTHALSQPGRRVAGTIRVFGAGTLLSAVLATGLVLVPRLLRAPAAALPEWIGAFAALALGFATARIVRVSPPNRWLS